MGKDGDFEVSLKSSANNLVSSLGDNGFLLARLLQAEGNSNSNNQLLKTRSAEEHLKA